MWLGVYPKEDWMAPVREILGTPEHIMPLGIIAVGYPAEEKPPADRYDPAKIRCDRW